MEPIDKKIASFEEIGLASNQIKKPAEQKKLGQEDFMDLMLTQMNHQDPFKPMENGEFLSQMAQFSAVSGLKDIKESFKSLADTMQSNHALQAASMVGRKVLVPGNSFRIPPASQSPAGKPFEVNAAVDLKVATNQLTVHIKDAKGDVVKEIDLGPRSAGKIDFKWDGKIAVEDETIEGAAEPEQAKPGNYKVEAFVNVDDKKQAVETFVYDMVDSVSVGHAGQPMTLNLTNAGQAKMSEVLKIM